jgi:amylosucrase
VRSGLPQLHGSAPSEVLPDTDDGVLAVVRTHASGPMVGLYNVTAGHRPFLLRRLHEAGVASPYEALSGYPVVTGEDGHIWLPPYAAWWIVDDPTR